MNLDLNKSLALLSQAGYPVDDADATLTAIAERYETSPKNIFGIVQSAALSSDANAETGGLMTESPPTGLGNTTIADLCARYGLNIKKVIRELKKKGIEASPDSKIKAIATAHNTSPIDIYEMIKEIQEQVRQ